MIVERERKHYFRLLSNYLHNYSKKYLKYEHNKGRELHRKVFKKILENISEAILESDGGVYMKGMGYFYIFTAPMKNIKRKNVCAKRTDFTYTKAGRNYLSFEPIGDKNPFTGFALDYKVDEKLKKKIQENIRNGRRYKSYLSTFKKVQK